MRCGKHLTTPTLCYHCALDQWGQRFDIKFKDERTYKDFLGYFPVTPEPTQTLEHKGVMTWVLDKLFPNRWR
jgi:hypothetical protein